jgi:flagellar FliL protein
MSAAAAETVAQGGASAPSGNGKKKLIIFIVVVMLLLVSAAGGAAVLIQKRRVAAAQAAMEADSGPQPLLAGRQHATTHNGPPTFLPLESFVVNLADRDSERYAQIGITLELNDPKFTEQMKAYMPAIRNGILMVLAHKTSQELLTRPGKERLAAEIMRESVRPMGIELTDDYGSTPAERARTGKTALEDSPVRHVDFSSFIIQ